MFTNGEYVWHQAVWAPLFGLLASKIGPLVRQQMVLHGAQQQVLATRFAAHQRFRFDYVQQEHL